MKGFLDWNGALRFVRAVVVLVICVGGVNGVARADYYKYIDKSGAVCITNNLKSVPEKYRASMKVIREESLEKKDQSQNRQGGTVSAASPETAPESREANSAAAAEPTSTYGRLAARFPWFKPLLFVAAIFCAFVLVTKLVSILPSPLMARVIYLAFFLGIFAFTYKAYADHVVDSYSTVKKKVLALFEKGNRREVPEPGELPPAIPAKEQPSQ